MLTQMHWLVEGRVLVAEHSGAVHPQDLIATSFAMTDWIEREGKPPCVHVLLDFTNVTADAEAEAAHFTPKRANVHPRAGWMIVIDPTGEYVARVTTANTGQALRARLKFVRTMDEAHDLLNTLDYSAFKP